MDVTSPSGWETNGGHRPNVGVDEHAAARAAGTSEGGEGHEERVAERIDASARTRRLAGALAGLDAGYRDVLLLTSWAGLDSNEVAQALGIPVSTVRSRLHRARTRLRAHETNTEKARNGDE
ncbi:sigma-70 family RNA polymerase sigma factor [Umezawaea beigongshangensis]|uniref:RNA polymerase sigma factor n=1 Tax=Umezawaea beigongshangensis TaxID=2780383 RepID=UPI0018F15BE5